MARIPATEFKAKCLALMDRVAEKRETYVITKRGKPVARLVPVEPPSRDPIFGWLRGKAEVVGDIMSPVVPAEAWETLREWDELNAPEPSSRRGRARRTRKAGRHR
jgi:prevent-host-death family protein